MASRHLVLKPVEGHPGQACVHLNLQQIREQLAQGLAVLDQLRDRPEVHTLDVHFACGLLTREADRQHGRVWPA